MTSSLEVKKRKNIKEEVEIVPHSAKKLKAHNEAHVRLHTTTSHSPKHDVFKPFTLKEIQNQISRLTEKVPHVPLDGLDPNDQNSVHSWAAQMQTVIEEFNLCLCCISTATYKWGTDRSGAADQNLSLLNNELLNAQDQIGSSISPKLTNILAPVVDLVTYKTVTTKDATTGEETKLNFFRAEENDPAFMVLCSQALCRNASMMRAVLLSNFHRAHLCIGDYINATKKDGDNSRGLAY